MGILVRHLSHGTASAPQKGQMHSTFTQKVIICMVAGFLAACLVQWGKVFVEGADDALNGGYNKSPAVTQKARP